MTEVRSLVIFLDIDGVLCTRRAAGWARNGTRLVKGTGLVRNPPRAWDRRAVALLDRMLLQSGASIVLSSAWRLRHDVPGILRSAGLTGHIHEDWRTDDLGPTRAHEIKRWLDGHATRDYLVLDDKAAGLELVSARLVRTDGYLGLTAADVDRGLALLASGRPIGGNLAALEGRGGDGSPLPGGSPCEDVRRPPGVICEI